MLSLFSRWCWAFSKVGSQYLKGEVFCHKSIRWVQQAFSNGRYNQVDLIVWERAVLGALHGVTKSRRGQTRCEKQRRWCIKWDANIKSLSNYQHTQNQLLGWRRQQQSRRQVGNKQTKEICHATFCKWRISVWQHLLCTNMFTQASAAPGDELSYKQGSTDTLHRTYEWNRK